MIQHFQRHNNPATSRGITLVELMIAVAISGILLVGVGVIYGNSRRTYNVDEEFAHLQQDARIAMKFLIEDIRMAGYMGCVKNIGDTDNDPTNAGTFQCYLDTGSGGSYICNNIASGIEGFDAIAGPNWDSNGATGLPAQIPTGTNPPAAGSDVIIIRRGSDDGIALAGDKNNDANFDIVHNGSSLVTQGTNECDSFSGICEGDVLLASDCNKSRVFQATNLTITGGNVRIVHSNDNTYTPSNSTPNWGGNGDPSHFLSSDTEIMKFRTFAYYVVNKVDGTPALFRHNGISGSAPEELIEGVENMQILYGVDIDGDGIANRYAAATDVNFGIAAQPIVSVRISFLMRNKSDLPGRPSVAGTFDLDNDGTDDVSVTDQRLRKTFTTTVKVRNKGL